MGRRWMLIGGWVLSTVAATLIAWTAVRQVTAEVGPAPVLPLPADVALADAAPAAPTAVPTTRPSPSRTAQPPPADQDPQPDPEDAATVTRAYDLVGGVVTIRYSGSATDLVEASPRSGFVVEVNDGGPGKVDVRFRSDDHESRFTTRVRDGEPDPERDERPR